MANNIEFIQEYHFDCDSPWKIEFTNMLLGLDNEDLIDMVMDAQRPDDWEGDYTDKGEWKAMKSKQLLKTKLREWKFL